jgi:hypothetical protein
MKKAMPVLKALWLLITILLIMVGRALPMALLIFLAGLTIAAPLVREFICRSQLDERQRYISHLSSHVAYFTYTMILVFIMITEFFAAGQTARPILVLLLLVPLLVKIAIVLWQRYGAPKKRLSDYVQIFFRGIVPSSAADERQHVIGNFSSHIAFYVFLVLIISAMLWLYIRNGQNPPNLWYLLLIVPLLSKLYASLFMSYGAVRGAQFIGATIVLLFFIFILLSHGFSAGSLIEALPFIVILGLIGWAIKQPRLAGAMLIILALGLVIFFKGWLRMDLYGLILMFSLIPIPLLISGVALMLAHPSDT